MNREEILAQIEERQSMCKDEEVQGEDLSAPCIFYP